MSPVFASTPGNWRSLAAMLALIALALLMLRPICELAFGTAHGQAARAAISAQQSATAHPGNESPEVICCASVDGGEVVMSAQLLKPGGSSGALAVVLLVLAAIPQRPVRRSLARVFLADPPFRTYHARSARILR